MISRRQFLKVAGLSGLAMAGPSFLWKPEARADLIDIINYSPPSVMPQIIHVFLYGGPSELAGNLTNIEDIASNSQNPYPAAIDSNNPNNDITPNKFWGGAGGNIMEQLLANGDMSLYRTVNRIKDDSKAHGRSITQNLVGNLDLSHAGIAATLADILDVFNPFGKSIDALLLPFVSFEGSSSVFNPGGLFIPVNLRPLDLNANFNNPYTRSRNGYLDAQDSEINDQRLDDLAQLVSPQYPVYEKVNDAFLKRSLLADFIENSFNSEQVNADLPVDPDTAQKVAYPDSNLGKRLRAAVSLAIKNPDSVFISLGSGGLGGWDDHSGALDNYPGRVQSLMEALQVAARHLELAGASNIVINVFGDFGRNVNINDSNGWDHGNNQNFFTIGGSAIAGRALGKLAGKTEPAGSYQCEPFSIASTIYKYFGVQNPEVLTGEPAIDETDNVTNELI
jgi:hypothetical protein